MTIHNFVTILRVFGSSQNKDSFQWSFCLAETLATQFGSSDHMMGQAYAAEYANAAINSFVSSLWFENEILTREVENNS